MKLSNNKLYKLFSRNWQIKVISLLVALLVYASISYLQSAAREVTIPLNVIQNSNYIAESYIPSKINIYIEGNEEIIYLIEPDKLEATLDLSMVTKKGISKVLVKLSYDGPDTIKTKVNFYSDPSTIRIKFKER